MLGILLWKEIRGHLMTFRFGAALVTTLVLVIVSAWVLGDDFQRRRNAYNLAVETSNQQNSQVVVPSRIRPFAHRPPSPLAIFAQGEERRFGDTVQVSRWEVPRRAQGSFNNNVLLSAEPALDLSTIFVFVVSLFGILISFDGISGERENGVLKMQCVTNASRATIYTAKFLGGVTCLAIPFLVSFLGGLLLLLFFFDLSFTPVQWAAVALMLSTGLLYGALFVAIGLVCSAAVRWSPVALVLSLLVWVAGVLLIPVAADGAAGLLAPMPSSTEIANIEKSSLRDAVKELEQFGKKHPAYWGGFMTGGWSIPGDGNCFRYDGSEANYRQGALWVQTFEPYMQQRAERIWDAFRQLEDIRTRHTDVFELVALTSPAHQLRKMFTALAATDFEAYEVFMDDARRHRRVIISELQRRGLFGDKAYMFFSRRPEEEIDNAKYAQRAQYYRQQLNEGRRADEFADAQKEWGSLPAEEIPQFNYAPSNPDFARALGPLGVLAAMLAAVFALGLFTFIRYDVR